MHVYTSYVHIIIILRNLLYLVTIIHPNLLIHDTCTMYYVLCTCMQLMYTTTEQPYIYTQCVYMYVMHVSYV